MSGRAAVVFTGTLVRCCNPVRQQIKEKRYPRQPVADVGKPEKQGKKPLNKACRQAPGEQICGQLVDNVRTTRRKLKN